jgi:hypothetical protein
MLYDDNPSHNNNYIRDEQDRPEKDLAKIFKSKRYNAASELGKPYADWLDDNSEHLWSIYDAFCQSAEDQIRQDLVEGVGFADFASFLYRRSPGFKTYGNQQE